MHTVHSFQQRRGVIRGLVCLHSIPVWNVRADHQPGLSVMTGASVGCVVSLTLRCGVCDFVCGCVDAARNPCCAFCEEESNSTIFILFSTHIRNTAFHLSSPQRAVLINFDGRDTLRKQHGSPRRKRELPQPDSKFHGLRRTQSLSFLPGSTENTTDKLKRRLPDPGQGRMIQCTSHQICKYCKHIASRLKEESLVRIKVAKELKEEKRLRWKTEDDLVSAQAVISKLRGKVKEQSEQISSLERDLTETKRNYEDVSDRLAEFESKKLLLAAEQKRLDEELTRHQEQEATLEQAWSELDATHRAYSQLQDKYSALVSAIEEVQPGASTALLEAIDGGTSSTWDGINI
eukprot:gene884-7903_t